MNTIRYLAAITMAAIMLANVAIAADMDVPPVASPQAPITPKDIPVQQNQPNCSRWTDECVTCTRGANGEAPICSNTGIACQPKAIHCLSVDTPRDNLPK